LKNEEDEECALIWASLRPEGEFAPILRLKAFMYAIMGYKSDWMINSDGYSDESFASNANREVIGVLTPIEDGKRLVFTKEEVDKVHALFWTMSLNRRDFAGETKNDFYNTRSNLREKELEKEKVDKANDLP